ncbi:hypothetical protein Taro_046785 [Colocasia esculenta]|uniref:Yippee domain-containing protein n=1 Tax=Colocasia esculenta TaxID=4460 RepID=A0A843X7L7_COLES|nr:hypothetical protein [Colocasia esculenta]
MGRLHLVLLDGDAYTCKFCMTQLALRMDIFSKFFQCRHGKAYLFTNVWLIVIWSETSVLLVIMYLLSILDSVNVTLGQKQERLMTTGMHTVADIFCVGCGSILGWKYETAHVKTQEYKEGMFILERSKTFLPNKHLSSSADQFFCAEYSVLMGPPTVRAMILKMMKGMQARGQIRLICHKKRRG